ncbi:hypothetical protein [Georgenia satyanarayanai]|uniref:hypothetical protein n=1 Tax=Georgenia satyanarayanai TaxID=860221 RepID=UPI0012642A31|nr:hypothetical protein [Georgenia satyanarayanai]
MEPLLTVSASSTGAPGVATWIAVAVAAVAIATTVIANVVLAAREKQRETLQSDVDGLEERSASIRTALSDSLTQESAARTLFGFVDMLGPALFRLALEDAGYRTRRYFEMACQRQLQAALTASGPLHVDEAAGARSTTELMERHERVLESQDPADLIAATDDTRRELVKASQQVHAELEAARLALSAFDRRTDWTRHMQTGLLVISLILVLAKDLLPD